eukprot:m.132986 g.132986  ORF g.132986 m.132986 type:complete len:153 (-) comp14660_c0_seq1:90-548(-)
MFAAMSADEVSNHNWLLMAFSGLFLVAAWIGTSLFGSLGFILANIVNMSVRIIRSYLFIGNYCTSHQPQERGHPLLRSTLSLQFFIMLLLSLVISKISEAQFCCDGIANRAYHIVVGAILLCATMLVLYTKDRKFLNDVISLFQGRSQEKRS